MTLKFNRVLSIVEYNLVKKFYQVKCTDRRVIILTEKKHMQNVATMLKTILSLLLWTVTTTTTTTTVLQLMVAFKYLLNHVVH